MLTERLESGSYETRFYLADGWLVEEYAVAGRPYGESDVTRLAVCGRFSFELADGLLTVSCDGASSRVALRCSQAVEGGAR